jgi:hypothetical protein
MIIDESLPVHIRVAKGNEEAVVTAQIVREGDRFYAVPTLTAGGHVGRITRIPLDEDRLELIPNAAGGRPSYRYRGVVHLEP